MRLRPRRLAALIAAVGLALLAKAAYIPSKALVAQLLLQHAWTSTRHAGRPQRPWPWADTEPVARLRQPRLGIDQVVLVGASGRTLAFAPGWVHGTGRPGTTGNVVLSGHRDTHFRWLSGLLTGDLLELEAVDGSVRHYRVAAADVHHATSTWLLEPTVADRLLLLTCFPFDAVDPGTPWRYVVTALPESEDHDKNGVANALVESNRHLRAMRIVLNVKELSAWPIRSGSTSTTHSIRGDQEKAP